MKEHTYTALGRQSLVPKLDTHPRHSAFALLVNTGRLPTTYVQGAYRPRSVSPRDAGASCMARGVVCSIISGRAHRPSDVGPQIHVQAALAPPRVGIAAPACIAWPSGCVSTPHSKATSFMQYYAITTQTVKPSCVEVSVGVQCRYATPLAHEASCYPKGEYM